MIVQIVLERLKNLQACDQQNLVLKFSLKSYEMKRHDFLDALKSNTLRPRFSRADWSQLNRGMSVLVLLHSV